MTGGFYFIKANNFDYCCENLSDSTNFLNSPNFSIKFATRIRENYVCINPNISAEIFQTNNLGQKSKNLSKNFQKI